MKEVLSHPFFTGIDFEKLQKREILPPYKPSEEQMTLKDKELFNAESLKEIRVEDETDDIPLEKKFLIEQNQMKFKDF